MHTGFDFNSTPEHQTFTKEENVDLLKESGLGKFNIGYGRRIACSPFLLSAEAYLDTGKRDINPGQIFYLTTLLDQKFSQIQ